jgi:hypothetical protein
MKVENEFETFSHYLMNHVKLFSCIPLYILFFFSEPNFQSLRKNSTEYTIEPYRMNYGMYGLLFFVKETIGHGKKKGMGHALVRMLYSV